MFIIYLLSYSTAYKCLYESLVQRKKLNDSRKKSSVFVCDDKDTLTNPFGIRSVQRKQSHFNSLKVNRKKKELRIN